MRSYHPQLSDLSLEQQFFREHGEVTTRDEWLALITAGLALPEAASLDAIKAGVGPLGLGARVARTGGQDGPRSGAADALALGDGALD